jgi:endonuclease/exonuclease/phosphatase (EEP) superfamily protein YafD
MLALLGALPPPLDALADLAPVGVVASLVLLGAAWLLSLQRATLAGALLGALAAPLLMAPELMAAARPAPRSPADAPALTLLTINLWSANQRLAAVDDLIRTEHPDIIVAQEAWAPWKAYLESLAPEYQVHVGCRYDSDCNVVILSRLRLIDVVAPPDNGMAAVRLALPARFGAGAVDVLGVHLTRPSSASAERRQLAQIAAMNEGLAPSLLAAGDFNTTPWSRLSKLDAIIPATRRTRAMFTWPAPAREFTALSLRAPAPLVPIDHVYASSDWRTVEIRRGPDVGSDHYPIIATFTQDLSPRLRSAPAS